MVQATGKAFTDPRDSDIVIQLGFAEPPKNSLVTKAPFLPSKIGGDPAWIAPPIPQEQLTCSRC